MLIPVEEFRYLAHWTRPLEGQKELEIDRLIGTVSAVDAVLICLVKTEFTVKVKPSIYCSSNIPIPTMCSRPRSLVIQEWLSVDLLLLLNFKTKQSRWFSQVQLGGSKSRTCERDYVSLLECLCVPHKKLESRVWSLSMLINIYI